LSQIKTRYQTCNFATDLKEQHHVHCRLTEIIKVFVKDDIFFPNWQSWPKRQEIQIKQSWTKQSWTV